MYCIVYKFNHKTLQTLTKLFLSYTLILGLGLSETYSYCTTTDEKKP